MIHTYIAIGIIWAIIMLGENLRRFSDAKWYWLAVGVMLNGVLWPISFGFAIYDVVIKGDDNATCKTKTRRD